MQSGLSLHPVSGVQGKKKKGRKSGEKRGGQSWREETWRRRRKKRRETKHGGISDYARNGGKKAEMLLCSVGKRSK